MSWPTAINPCPENKKVKKIENGKIKKKKYLRQPTTTTSLVVSRYQDSNSLPHASRTPFLPPHHTITSDSIEYGILLY
jgi:hypothetical protein